MKNPMLDIEFLKRLDADREREVYAKIIALNFDEDPTEEITGKVTQGSINIDGESAIRRSCSVSLIAKDVNINEFYWGLNTKFKLYVGLKNHIDPQYEDIIWFKQGTFLINSFNTSLSTNNYTINISGKDKMCLLNGDIGGMIKSLSAQFDSIEEVDDYGNITLYKYPIKEIIREAVHQYAGEPYHNIIIDNLDDEGFELMEYRGDVTMYMMINNDTNEVTNIRFDDPYVDDSQFIYKIYDTKTETYTDDTISIRDIDNFIYDTRIVDLEFSANNIKDFTHVWVQAGNVKYIYTVAAVEYGTTCGYRLTDLIYPDDLIVSAGTSITNGVLDKLKQMLGEYEYFYDLDGRFHFQRKRTYVNNSWNNIVNNKDEVYVDSAAYTSAFTYSFTNSNLVSAFNNTPNLMNLRNDFAIWGKKQSSSGAEIPIHLRYAIDKKPGYYKNYAGKTYITQEEFERLQASSESSLVYSFSDTSIITAKDSRFHVTPLPKGLSSEWWEIDDWARRYLYYADIYSEHDINYYLTLTSEEVYNIVKNSYSPGSNVTKDFNYYVYQLKNQKLGSFNAKWHSEDWLTVLSPPYGRSRYNSYYIQIENAISQGKVFWCWLFDTALDDTGHEYIKSIEHGTATTSDVTTYPTRSASCNHYFSYALERKREGASAYYHMYIYDPEVPDSLKADVAFAERIDTDAGATASFTLSNYEICDWREIIYQMAIDYYKHQHDEDFLASVAENNPDYYPQGYTGYEIYYIDIEGFWRELYNPDIEPIDLNTFEPTQDYNHYYIWDNIKQTFMNFSFREATDVKPIENNKTYYYFGGTVYLDDLIGEGKVTGLKTYEEYAASLPPQAPAAYTAYYTEMAELINNSNVYGHTLVQKSDTSWSKYIPYTNYKLTDKYYTFNFAADITGITGDKTYYFLDDDDNWAEWTITVDSDDKTPKFESGRKYYIAEGKVGTLSGTNTQKIFKKVSTLRQGEKYYQLNNDNTFSLLLDLSNTNINYYSLVVSGNGTILPSKVSSFTRGETYYIEDNNSPMGYTVAFEFKRDIVYYLDVGYTLILDLSNIDSDAGYYYEMTDTNLTKVKKDEWIGGKIYYGYTPIEDPQNGDCYKITVDSDNKIVPTKIRLLRNFERGYTYYVYENGYDLVEPYDTVKTGGDYYVLTPGGYVAASMLISNFLETDGSITNQSIITLKETYGLIVDPTQKKVIDTVRTKDVYLRQMRMRPCNYYTYGFYEVTTKRVDGVQYYEISNKTGEYIPVATSDLTDEKFANYKYYIKINTSETFGEGDEEQLRYVCYLTDEFNPSTHWTYKLSNPEDLIFWFDFLDLEGDDRKDSLAQYAVQVIGDRPKAVNDDKVKAIYYRDTPTVLFIGADEKVDADSKQTGYTYINLTETIDNLFSISAQGKSAFDMLNDYLYSFSYCTESISMTTIPVYYLEPNTRVYVHDEESGINGQYIISKMTIPLTYNGTMSITATKAVDRII